MPKAVTDEELDSYYQEPLPGEIWWCEGNQFGFHDGGKTRPVLVISVSSLNINVIPLTSRKSLSGGVIIKHRAGTSFLLDARTFSVPTISLLAPLGKWSQFAAWKLKSGIS